MEFCEGGSITNLMTKLKRSSAVSMSECWVSYICSEILNGLEYLHQKDIMHRDIKDDNVLFRNNADVVIADFGLVADDVGFPSIVVGVIYK
jgi:serine/threonine protein kinase